MYVCLFVYLFGYIRENKREIHMKKEKSCWKYCPQTHTPIARVTNRQQIYFGLDES